MVSVGSARMKRSTTSYVDKVLRSGKRLFADRFEDEMERVKLISLSFVDTQVNKIRRIDCGMDVGNDVPKESFKLGELKKLNVNGTDDVLGNKLGELSLVADNHVGRVKRFGSVYTRKRKRTVRTDLSVDANHSSEKMYERKYFKKRVRISSESGFDGKYAIKKGPIVFAFAASCSSSIYWFSCFVSSVLRYLSMTKLFSWRQFRSFLLLELTSSTYSSIGSRILQDSTYTTSHGLFKVFGSIHSIPSFTLNFNSLPFYFLYIHSNLLLKHALLPFVSIPHLTDKNATNYDYNMPSISTLKTDLPLAKLVVAKKARSATKRIPRVSLFNKLSQSILPVPGVMEIAGYAEEDYVPFMLPESYISSKSDEVTRILEKSYPLYDMDSDDELWLKNSDNAHLSEDTFEKIIDAYERGIYCSPHDYSDAASAVDRCLELASMEVLEDVYKYWMTKRKKKRSALVRVFQCYKQKRVKRHFTSAAVLRKKRSVKRRASQRFAVKQLDFKKAMLNDEKLLEESTKAYMEVHEAQEAAKRLEEASIVKRQQAQALMEAADLAAYKATMALRIAEALAAGGSVNLVLGGTPVVE